MIKADKTRLIQIIRVLISNAIIFTKRGTIKLKVRYNMNANHLEFVIKDTGVGISEIDLPKLFKPFSKLPETNHMHKNGVGLNLHIAKLLIKKLHGKI